MKKLLIIIPLIASTVFAQNTNSSKSDMKMKSENSDQSVNPLDGKAYKVTFTMAGDTEKKMNSTSHNSMKSKTSKTKDRTQTQNTDYDQTQLNTRESSKDMTASETPSPLAHKKAVLRFENGMIQSSLLSKENISGCAYHVTSTGSNQLYSFISTCMNTMNSSHNNKSYSPSSGNNNSTIVSPSGTDVSSPRDNTSTPNTNSNSISGSESTTPSPSGSSTGTGTISTTPPVTSSPTDKMNENSLPNTANQTDSSIQLNKTQNAMGTQQENSSSAVSASISGLIDGNSISGTLTCWTADGKMVKYNFTGTKASKSEINSESEIGMK
jgi:hypothetical protein